MTVGDPPSTCGEGLAQNAVLPSKLSELLASLARILEVHTRALDRTDERTAAEHDAYIAVAASHRAAAQSLQALAESMRSHRGIPMGRHETAVLLSKDALQAFEEFVRLERELKELLDQHIEEHQKMLIEMVTATSGGATSV